MIQRARSEAESGVRDDSELAPSSAPISTPVDRIGSLTAAELAEASPPARGLRSGAFAKRPDGSTALDWKTFQAPPPPPPAAGVIAPASRTERAELRIVDYSLQSANPFVGSSLQPPPPKKRPWLKPLLFTVAGAALLCAGYVGALYHSRTTTADTAAHVPAKTVAAPPAPVIEATPATPARETAVTAAAATSMTATSTAPIAPPAVETRVAIPAKVRAVEAKPLRGGRARVRGRTRVGHESAAEATEQPAPIAAPVTAPKGPEQLTRAQVKTALESVRPALNTCAAGARGEIMANVTITGAGRVTHAMVEGAFAGTPQGSCMARALRGAQFPAFTSPQLRVRYPFVF